MKDSMWLSEDQRLGSQNISESIERFHCDNIYINTNSPFLIMSLSHPTLPIVVKCKSQAEADTVNMMNLALHSLPPIPSNEDIIQVLKDSDLIQRVTSYLPAPFYPIYSCSAGYRIVLRDYV